MNPSLNRREFVKRSIGTAAAVAALRTSGGVAASEKVVVGIMGVGGRGTVLARMFAQHPDVQVAYVSDADARRAAPAGKAVEEAQGRPARFVQDFRRILEDEAVDAMVIATPDHWHALGTILACQAGKHVYVEKPMAHSVWEGRQMVAAARKYRRVVTVGMQTRSAPYARAAREFVQSGKLGSIHLVRVYNMMQHSRRTPGSKRPVPPEFDYDLWCGPAAKLPYGTRDPWLNFAEYSCGPIPGDAVHQIDFARYLMGDPPPPKAVSHTGGIVSLRDGRDTPDTQLATYEYDGYSLLFQGALWCPYMKKIPIQTRESDQFPDWSTCSTKVEILGTEAHMVLGRHGGGWQVFDSENRLMQQAYGRPGDGPHIENFVECIRNGGLPNADVEQGHQSVLLCHLANIAWRTNQGSLRFDARTEAFPENRPANRFLKRETYRAPWIVPEQV